MKTASVHAGLRGFAGATIYEVFPLLCPRPNRLRTSRSISASVGRWWQQQFDQRCEAVLRLLRPKTGHTEKSRATGFEKSPQQPTVCTPGTPQTCATLALRRLDFLSALEPYLTYELECLEAADLCASSATLPRRSRRPSKPFQSRCYIAEASMWVVLLVANRGEGGQHFNA